MTIGQLLTLILVLVTTFTAVVHAGEWLARRTRRRDDSTG
jgi:hypothetical protein